VDLGSDVDSAVSWCDVLNFGAVLLLLENLLENGVCGKDTGLSGEGTCGCK
jgi:hypothetical protein